MSKIIILILCMQVDEKKESPMKRNRTTSSANYEISEEMLRSVVQNILNVSLPGTGRGFFFDVKLTLSLPLVGNGAFHNTMTPVTITTDN